MLGNVLILEDAVTTMRTPERYLGVCRVLHSRFILWHVIKPPGLQSRWKNVASFSYAENHAMSRSGRGLSVDVAKADSQKHGPVDANRNCGDISDLKRF